MPMQLAPWGGRWWADAGAAEPDSDPCSLSTEREEPTVSLLVEDSETRSWDVLVLFHPLFLSFYGHV